jgi:transposase InsO family protein
MDNASAPANTKNGTTAGSQILPTPFDRICRENGTDHLLTGPRRPQTTGKIERFQPGHCARSSSRLADSLARW